MRLICLALVQLMNKCTDHQQAMSTDGPVTFELFFILYYAIIFSYSDFNPRGLKSQLPHSTKRGCIVTSSSPAGILCFSLLSERASSGSHDALERSAAALRIKLQIVQANIMQTVAVVALGYDPCASA